MGVVIKPVFLDSTTDTLVRRYSESRRKHPLSQTEGHDDAFGDQQRALVEAIELEPKGLRFDPALPVPQPKTAE